MTQLHSGSQTQTHTHNLTIAIILKRDEPFKYLGYVGAIAEIGDSVLKGLFIFLHTHEHRCSKMVHKC